MIYNEYGLAIYRYSVIEKDKLILVSDYIEECINEARRHWEDRDKSDYEYNVRVYDGYMNINVVVYESPFDVS